MNEPSQFKQLWNAVWHFQTPTDPTVDFLVDIGAAHVICYAIIIVPVLIAFAIYCWYLERIYWTIPERKFQRRHEIAGRTKDFTVYDMSDDELDRYEAAIDC